MSDQSSGAFVEKMPKIELVSEEFMIPQLNKTRKIYALLPPDYDETDQRYPVLYLQDAQNLFENRGPFGSWNIDMHLSKLYKEGMGNVIIVAIDHGGKERIQEYSPYHHRQFGQGQGKHYAHFIIHSLKPHIDGKYRTLPDRDHTGIGGSSMGGLISAYIGIVHPTHFSKLMIFSPSFWYSDEIYFDAFQYAYTLPMRMFIYGGAKESIYMSKHIHRFKDAIGYGNFHEDINDFNVIINEEGEHNEQHWSEMFPNAVKWLFFNGT